MSLSNEDLGRLVERASTLAERLEGSFVPVGGDLVAARHRLERWKQSASSDHEEDRRRSLRSGGLHPCDENELLPLFGTVRRRPDVPWPAWSGSLRALVEDIARRFHDPSLRLPLLSHEGGNSLPFEPLHRAIAAFAWKQVDGSAAPTRVLSPPARRGLQSYLMRRVSGIISTALHPAFIVHKAVASEFMDQQPFWVTNEEITQTDLRLHYRAFVQAQGEDGLSTFFLRHPAAARLVATVTMFWVEFVVEFLLRLESDLALLSEQFGTGKPLGRVAAIRTGVSDPHHHGRNVVILTFEEGLRLVYKPRPMEVDHLFVGLVAELNALPLKPELYAPKVLDRGGYGWMEFARHTPCANRQAGKRFYRRAGSLACLLYWLRGVDCHRKNMVAAGEHPVLVDLESLGHPAQTGESEVDRNPSSWRLSETALRTGLLPFWQHRPKGGSLYDNTALGAPICQRPLTGSIRWEDLNSDLMHWQLAERSEKHLLHRPRVANKALGARQHETDVVAGYVCMAKLLEGRGRVVLDVFHDRVHHAARRWIKRPTVAYAVLLRRSVRPEYLNEGIDRSLVLQDLPYQPSVSVDERQGEIDSMENLDVPCFRAANSGAVPQTEVSQSSGEQLTMLRASLNRRLILINGQLHPVTNRRQFLPRSDG